jgi:tol-pal system protein YbgF
VSLSRPGVRAIAAALLVAGCCASARAALFDDDEARKRIDATNQRLTQIEKQLEERIAVIETQLKSQGLVELFNQVELLKADTARLRGEFEVLAHEQDEAQKRARDLYIDLDTRLRKLEAAAQPPAAPPGAPGAPPGTPGVPPNAAAPPAGAAGAPGAGVSPGTGSALPPPPPPSSLPGPASGRAPAPPAPDATAEQRAYDAALDQFKSGNYGSAIGAFAAFTKAYPKSPLAPSAQYWIGNAYFAQRDFRSAIATQRQLVSAYPDSAKVPDALLNIATAQFELGDTAGARRTLNDVIAKYPQSDAAAKARQRLAAPR